MKKIAFIGAILLGVIAMGSCDYDDSNDLDVLTPNDTTQTSLLSKNMKFVKVVSHHTP